MWVLLLSLLLLWQCARRLETAALSVFLVAWFAQLHLSKAQQQQQTPGVDYGNLTAEAVAADEFVTAALQSVSGSFTSSNSASVFHTALTDSGYDNAFGTDPICWNGVGANLPGSQSDLYELQDNPLVEGFVPIASSVSMFEGCRQVVRELQVLGPREGESLETERMYLYRVEFVLNLTTFAAEGKVLFSESGALTVAVQIRLCAVGRSGFCTPFVHEQALARERKENSSSTTKFGDSHGGTHVDSEWVFVNVPADYDNSLFYANASIPTRVNRPGTYFVIGTLQFYTRRYEAIYGSAGYPPVHAAERWDAANAMIPERIIQYQAPPTILQVSTGAKAFSYVVIAFCSIILLFLIFETIQHRSQHILKLSQGDFLLVFLLSALVATISIIFREPKNDSYCQLSLPLVLMPVQLMYAITAGRLWRINKVLSPLLDPSLHHRNNGVESSRLQRMLSKLTSSRNVMAGKKSAAIRAVVSTRRLAAVVAFFAFPQFLLQLLSLTLQPQRLAIHLNEEGTTGRVECRNGFSVGRSLVTYSFLALGLLIVAVLIMGHFGRKLPSALNETMIIYEATMTSMVLLVLGVIVVFLTDTPTTSPDVEYLVWLVVTVSITMNASVRIMFPKILKVWQGEIVIVSKLVADHHRKNREKELSKALKGSNLLRNVTGLDNQVQRELQLFKHVSSGDLHRQANSWMGRYADVHDQDYIESAGANPTVDGALDDAQLEQKSRDLSELGDAFRQLVDVKDRRYRTRIYKRCFIGAEAVDAMVYAGLSTSRPKAVRLARTLADELGLFKHVAGEHEFKDSYYFYRLAEDDGSHSFAMDSACDSSITETASTSQNRGALAAKADAFRRCVDVQDRKYHLATYKNCFVGCEAVDAMLFSGLAKTRFDCVQLGRKLSRELRLFRHVSGEHSFSDDYLFFRFSESDSTVMSASLSNSAHCGSRVDAASLREIAFTFRHLVCIKDRRYKTRIYKSCFVGSDAVDCIVYYGITKTRWDALQLLRRLEKELGLFEHVCGDHILKDAYLFYRFTNDVDLSSSEDAGSDTGRSAILSRLLSQRSELADKADAFRRCIDIQDRRFRMITYRKCFVGAEAVDALVHEGIAKTRWEAVQIGRTLARELRLFSHVTGDHPFQDEFLFFRFREAVEYSAGSGSVYSGGAGRGASGCSDASSEDSSGRGELAQKAVAFRERVLVKDRRYHGRMYKNVFLGSEAVDVIVMANLAPSRWDAVLLGRRFARELGLFAHVTGDHLLKDEYLFYRFNEAAVVGEQEFRLGESATDFSGSSQKNKLVRQADAFRNVIDCQDRKYRMATYRNCFVGSEAVDSLVYSGLAKSRGEAVQLGRTLARELRLFSHVTGDHPFKDDYLFFRFRDADELLADVDSSNGSVDDDGRRSELLEKASEFRQRVPVKDRRYRGRLFRQCFIGAEAVDVLVFSTLAENRRSAVQLGRAFARELGLFEHVTRAHLFKDEYLFFKFNDEKVLDNVSDCESITDSLASMTHRSVLAEKANVFRRCIEVKDRRYGMITYKNCFVGSEAVDALVRANLVKTRSDAIELGRMLARELRLFKHVTGEHSFADEWLFYRFLKDDAAVQSSAVGPTDSDFEPDESRWGDLSEMAIVFRKHVQVKDRRYHGQLYKACFVGAEAVDALVFARLAETRGDAVQLGRTLAAELNLFKHVTGDHSFRDSFLFYSFEPDSDEAFSIEALSDDGSGNGDTDGQVVDKQSALVEKSLAFKQCVDVRDRKRNMQSIRQCFVGSEAVDCMVYYGLADSRWGAVVLGRAFVEELRMFRHCTDLQPFSDDDNLFCFCEQDLSSEVDAPSHTLRRTSNLDMSRKALADNAAAFKKFVSSKDRTHRMKNYKNTFVGSHAVDALIKGGVVESRWEAVQFSRMLAREWGLFDHVTEDYAFYDSPLLYQYCDLEESRVPFTSELSLYSLPEISELETDDTFDGHESFASSPLIPIAEADESRESTPSKSSDLDAGLSSPGEDRLSAFRSSAVAVIGSSGLDDYSLDTEIEAGETSSGGFAKGGSETSVDAPAVGRDTETQHSVPQCGSRTEVSTFRAKEILNSLIEQRSSFSSAFSRTANTASHAEQEETEEQPAEGGAMQ